MRGNLHIKPAVLMAAVIGLPWCGFGQGTVTDVNGTEYLLEAFSPDMQANVLETEEALRSGMGQGPLNVDTSGQFYLTPDAGARGGLSEELLVDYLWGIVVVPRPGDVRAEGWPGIEGIWHDFDDFPPEVGETLNSFIGTPVSLASLDLMVREVIKSYRDAGRPVVDVLLPEQDITSGVVQLVVIEGKLQRIRVEGVDAAYEDYLRRQMTIKKGDPVRSEQVERDLNWLNRSPYRKVDLIYAPGYEFGTTDIILRTVTSDPVWFYGSYENSGTEVLGEDRLLFGFNYGNIFGPDHGISYQLTTDLEFKTVQGHSLVYQGPTAWRHWVTVLGSFVDVNAEVPDGAGGTLLSGGQNVQGSFRYAIPLPSPSGQVRELGFGFDYKSSDNNLEFGGFPVFGVTTEIFQFSAGYDLTLNDRWGVTRFNLKGFYSPGEWTPQNTDLVFSESRALASADYLYANLGIERQQRLPEAWSARLRGTGQIASENLLASEQLGVGGYDTVRGFEQRVVRADQGFWGSFELYAPPVSLGRIMDWENETDELRFLAFYDAALISNVNRIPMEPNQVGLQSVGVGLRWRYSDWFRLRLDYGWPVGTDNTGAFVDANGRMHIGATANF